MIIADYLYDLCLLVTDKWLALFKFPAIVAASLLVASEGGGFLPADVLLFFVVENYLNHLAFQVKCRRWFSVPWWKFCKLIATRLSSVGIALSALKLVFTNSCWIQLLRDQWLITGGLQGSPGSRAWGPVGG